MLDLIAGVAIGAFLLAVAAQGKSPDLVKLAKRDSAFVKWAIAVGILYYLYNVPELHEIFGMVIAATAVAFLLIAMENNGQFFDSISAFWANL